MHAYVFVTALLPPTIFGIQNTFYGPVPSAYKDMKDRDKRTVAIRLSRHPVSQRRFDFGPHPKQPDR